MNYSSSGYPVVIFGDHLAAYGAIRSLGPCNIPIYLVSRDGKGLAVSSRYVKDVLTIHPCSNSFVTEFNKFITQNTDGKVVIMVAGDDQYLDVLTENDFTKRFKCTFPNKDVVCLVRQKYLTYDIAEEIGIPYPKNYYITNKKELQILIEKEQFRFPLLMKSEESRLLLKKFKSKGFLANNTDEILKNYEQYDEFFGKLLLQEMILGGEENLFCVKTVLNSQSDPIAVFVDKKIRSSGRFAACTLTQSTWSDQVVQDGLRLLKKIGYYGYASVEFKYDHQDNIFKLMEINGRISMNNSHALKCGINLPLLMYEEALNGPLPALSQPAMCYPEGIRWWYFWGDVLSLSDNHEKKTLKLFEFLKMICGYKTIIEPLCWRDPVPFLSTTYIIIKKGIKKSFRTLIGKRKA